MIVCVNLYLPDTTFKLCIAGYTSIIINIIYSFFIYKSRGMSSSPNFKMEIRFIIPKDLNANMHRNQTGFTNN